MRFDRCMYPHQYVADPSLLTRIVLTRVSGDEWEAEVSHGRNVRLLYRPSLVEAYNAAVALL